MITLKEYVVLLSLEPAVRLNTKLENITLNFDEVKEPKKVIISKIEETISGSRIQSGLSLRIFLSAENLKEAINEAKSFADGVISFITLATGVGLAIPSESLAYEITPNTSERDFIQIYHDPFRLAISRRTLNHEQFIQLMDHFMKSEAETRERIGRSIRWYRMGTATFDVFDRFNCFWIGLEALNPILQNKLKVGDDKTKCPKCHHEWISTPTVSGIRLFVQTKIPEGRKLYKRSHALRINLMHSKENLRKLHAEATELSPRIGEVLYRAISYLLGIKQWENIEYRKIFEKVPMRIELEATLVNGEPKALGLNGEDPYFEPTHEFAPKFSDAGITIEGKTSFTAHLNSNVKYRPREIRFYGDPETKGSIISTEVHKRDAVSENE
jgi:hypothetical protein